MKQELRKAARRGLSQASEVMAQRKIARASREKAIAKHAVRRAPAAMAIPPARMRAAGSPRSVGVVVAEGDSWFDYPGTDILSILEDDYGYEVESVAHKGDRVEQMAYGGGQLTEFARRLDKLLRRAIVPKAILLSGGGNDIAGTEFGVMLDHISSPNPGLNQRVVDGIIDDRLRASYVTIISAITKVSKDITGRTIPIVLHGYDHPVADGRGFLGGWWFLPGPWLEPGFRDKGFNDLAKRNALMRDLINQFNRMVEAVALAPEFSGHVKYLNLRNTLRTDSHYKKDWANELHPTKDGYKLVTRKYAELLGRLP
ncbi:MAG: SGNH/GDSL hydrolase family protein [Candidatus Latescibacteria bacterium]|nr:SGNH/GDSL hydrolase family protein [Candidatus Latescibacterota bacterium]